MGKIKPKQFLHELKLIYDKIPTPYAREVMFLLCKAYQEYKFEGRETALIGINDIFNYLIGLDILTITQNENGEYILPSQEELLNTINYLKRHGIPIIISTDHPTLHFRITDSPRDFYEQKKALEKSIHEQSKELQTFYKILNLLEGKINANSITF